MKEIKAGKIIKGDLIGSGSEAKIYKVKEGLYKEFLPGVNEDKRKGKRTKLLYLEKLEHLKKYYPYIYYFVVSEIKGMATINGYVMENVLGFNLDEIELTYEEKITILKLIRSILAEFNKEGIIYHDIRVPNIKYMGDGEIVLLDIDSITTPEYPNLDVIPTQLELYMVNGGKHGVNAQLAMFNKFTNSFLQEDYYKKRIVLDKDGMILMKSLINARPDSAFDHEYLYEHIKKI